VVYAEEGHDRSTASKKEFAIKRLKRNDKLLLISSTYNMVTKYFPIDDSLFNTTSLSSN